MLHASLASLGTAKTLPYLVMFAASNAGGWAGDWLINVRRLGVATGRKAVNTVGFWSAAAALMLMPGAAAGAPCNMAGPPALTRAPLGAPWRSQPKPPALAAPRPAPAGARSVGWGMLATTLVLGCAGFSRGGFSVNHMDVAPKFAGVVM